MFLYAAAGEGVEWGLQGLPVPKDAMLKGIFYPKFLDFSWKKGHSIALDKLGFLIYLKFVS